MAKKEFMVLISVLVAATILVFVWMLHTHSSYADSTATLQHLRQEAKTYSRLKKQWDNKHHRQRLIKKLTKIAKPTIRHKGKYMLLRFESLDTAQLDKLLQKIYRSTLQIQKLSAACEGADSCTLSLEIVL